MSFTRSASSATSFGMPLRQPRAAPRCRPGTSACGFAAAAAARGAVDDLDLDRLRRPALSARAIDAVEELLRGARIVGRLRRAGVELEHLDVAVDRRAFHEGDALALHGVGDDDLGLVGDVVEPAEGRLDRGRVVAVDPLRRASRRRANFASRSPSAEVRSSE